MKRLLKTIKNAIQNYFEKRILVDSIKYNFDSINKIAREIDPSSEITLKNLEERNKMVRQAIMFTTFNEQEMKNSWTKTMNQRWEEMFNKQAPNLSVDHQDKKYPENSFFDYRGRRQRESEYGLWNTYIYTYIDFLKAERISALYKFFEALRFNSFMELKWDNDFFIECNFEQLNVITEVLHTCQLAMERELEKTKNSRNKLIGQRTY